MSSPRQSSLGLSFFLPFRLVVPFCHQPSLPPTSHHFLPSAITSSQQPSLPPSSHHFLPSAITSSHQPSLPPISHHFLPSAITSSQQPSLPPSSHHFLPAAITSLSSYISLVLLHVRLFQPILVFIVIIIIIFVIWQPYCLVFGPRNVNFLFDMSCALLCQI